MTLLEILISFAIVSIILTSLLTVFSNFKHFTFQNQSKLEAQQISRAALFHLENGEYNEKLIKISQANSTIKLDLQDQDKYGTFTPIAQILPPTSEEKEMHLRKVSIIVYATKDVERKRPLTYLNGYINVKGIWE
ncbi:type II secretion system protein [Bacillus sp. FJAT-49732]|uniref:Type II secretion system protein n=2 Tax=Lederbergia citrisecunda TaxID=2833583 RepID=A0A942TPB9_9BACI|nr:type II secretion system protein [Lederbergia citrisecunda]